MLLVGVVLLAVGYSGGLGSPLAHAVQAFLDAAGAPLRNVHKLEPVIRLPLVLGLAHLLGRVPLPGDVPATGSGCSARPPRARQARRGRDRRAGRAGGQHVAGVDRPTDAARHVQRDTRSTGMTPRTGSRAQRRGPTPGRVLVVPGSPFATQVWGTSHDEPLQVLGDSPWGVRDSVPLTPPATIRAVDSVQRLLAAGRPSAGLADTLAQQGISYVVVRNDLDPGHVALGAADPGAPRDRRQSRPDEGRAVRRPGRRRHGAGIRRRQRPAAAVPGGRDLPSRCASTAGTSRDSQPARRTSPTPTALPRIDGGPEALLRLDERRRLQGQPPLGPALLTTDAQRAGLPVPLVTVTDTPLARETDYGRVDDHSSAIRAPGDPRHTFNRVPDYPADGAPVYGALDRRQADGVEFVRRRHRSAERLAGNQPGRRHRRRPGDQLGVQRTAVRGRSMAAGRLRQPDHQRDDHDHARAPRPSGRRSARLKISTANGTTTVRYDKPGQPLTAALPYGETPWVRVTAVGTDDGSAGVQFGITDLAITQYDANGFAHPSTCGTRVVVPGPPAGSRVAGWDLGTELLGRSGCADEPDRVRCAATMALAPEEPVNFSRTLTVPEPVTVTPTVWVRARQGPEAGRPLAQPGAARASGDADVIDVEARRSPRPTAIRGRRGSHRRTSCSDRTPRHPDAEAAAADRSDRRCG